MVIDTIPQILSSSLPDQPRCVLGQDEEKYKWNYLFKDTFQPVDQQPLLLEAIAKKELQILAGEFNRPLVQRQRAKYRAYLGRQGPGQHIPHYLIDQKKETQEV
jgi:hypothetical protein